MMCILFFIAVYRVLEELKYKHYSSQMERYLQLFHHRPVAASLYRKVSLGGGGGGGWVGFYKDTLFPVGCRNMGVPRLVSHEVIFHELG